MRVLRTQAAMLVGLLLLLAPVTLLGGIRVFPTQLFVEAPNRSTPISLTNTSDRPLEVWVSFKYEYPMSFNEGTVEFGVVDTTGGSEPNATTWLRAVPQRVVIQPSESQTVRIVGTPPGGFSEGESWGRVVVSWKKSEKLQAKKGEPGRLITTELVTETSVPIHFRRGAVRSGVTIRDFRATTDGKKLVVNMSFDKSGNAAFWGNMKFDLLTSSGKNVGSWNLPLVVYKNLLYRNSLEIDGVTAGQYTLALTVDNKHPYLSPGSRVPASPVAQSISVTLP